MRKEAGQAVKGLEQIGWFALLRNIWSCKRLKGQIDAICVEMTFGQTADSERC